MRKKTASEQVLRFAEMFSAMGTEPRLRIMRLLLSSHPKGLVVGDIGTELDIPSSTMPLPGLCRKWKYQPPFTGV